MAITTQQIKDLREETGAGVMDCRDALQQANGDYDEALDFLRQKGIATAAERADREALDGIVELYSHGDGRVGVMVEVKCETDFVARSKTFRTFAHEIALQIAAGAPRYVSPDDIPGEVIEEKRKDAREFALEEGKPENVIDRIVEGRLKKAAYFQQGRLSHAICGPCVSSFLQRRSSDTRYVPEPHPGSCRAD